MLADPYPVICLMGPTGSGKTALAMALVQKQRWPLDIISVDSAMVYRGLDIGTAKPTSEELRQYPHQLVDICDPVFPYSAGQFYKDAIQAIENSRKQNRIPLLVGGSMLYFHVLQHPLSDLPEAESSVRKQITLEAERKGWAALHEQLRQIDPLLAKHIHPNDKQRIQRALEIYTITQRPPSQYQVLTQMPALPYHFINIVLVSSDRAVLYQRLEKRFEHMLTLGFLDEVRFLYERGDLSPDLPAIRCVGYRQVWSYFEGQIDYEAMRETAITATRHLAKRQLTWLRNWKETFEIDSDSSVIDLVRAVDAILRKKLDW